MGLIDEAIALEERAEMYYRSAAEMTSDKGAARILTLLAGEEAAHAIALRTMNAGGMQAHVSLLEAARDWIGGAIEGGASTISSDAGLLELLRQAMETERVTRDFYRERGEGAGESEIGHLFERLARIEEGHYAFLSSLVEFYDRPNEWVEAAEFGLRAPY